jgi:nicotinamidase-related amidase
LERTAANLARALRRAREAGLDVVFIRFLGDRKHQRPNLIERDRRQRKPAKCLEGTWGADFFRVKPLPGETVVSKRSVFDAFFNPTLEAHLKKKKIRHLHFAGVYLDVCVDAAARTAFQKGYYVSVLGDCTESLHYPKSDVLRYMKKYYGAKIITSRSF